MVVYYATTHYQVLCAIIHKMIYKQEIKSTLLLSNSRADHFQLCEKVQKEKIFDQVILYKDKAMVSNATREYSLCQTTWNMKRIMNKLCKEVEKTVPFEIDNNNEYYLYSDFRPFSLYLINKKINYYYCEDACGVLSRPHLLMNVLKSPWTNKVIEYYSLNGQNDLVIKKYADVAAQEADFIDNKMVDFSIKELIGSLPAQQKKKLINIFNAVKIKKSQKEKVLLLTQPFIQRNKITIDEQRNIYGLILDYFFENKDIYIKPHPIDFLANYSEWFEKATVLDGKMPSEILNVCLNEQFDYGLSISSTAIYSLDKFLKNIIFFDNCPEQEMLLLHKYCLIIKIMEILNGTEFTLKTNDINQILFETLLKQQVKEDAPKIIFESANDIFGAENQNKNAEMSIYVLKKCRKCDIFELLKKNDIAIIFNYQSLYKNDYDFIEKYKDISSFFEIEITDMNGSVRKEEILVCSRNKKVLEKISEIDYQKELIHSKLKVKVSNYNFLSEKMKEKLIEILSLQNEEMRRKIK